MGKKRKLITEWEIRVGGRVFEISKSEERRDEILEILAKLYPGEDVSAKAVRHYINI